ncbi:hypothetical protein [Actinoplanes sp. NPDC051859]|uniref:hypothetical protein n=1 Tax=Actinoplanes sp. NPDC051859 TaxID=3363909 RepID=UPI00379F0AE2
MDHKIWMYLVYLAISIGLTVWVATTLTRNGLVFLEDVFQDTRLAQAVNHLLVMGFYLLNLGYVAVAMASGGSLTTVASALEKLSTKLGLVLLVLGLLHVLNVFFLGRYRRGRLRQQQTQPPLLPAGRLPAFPAGGPGLPATQHQQQAAAQQYAAAQMAAGRLGAHPVQHPATPAGPVAPSQAGPAAPGHSGPGTPSQAGPEAPRQAGPGTPGQPGAGTPGQPGAGTPDGWMDGRA